MFEVDIVTGELRRAGLKIRLQDQPFQVLAMLLERPGELVTREELRSRLWPSDTFLDFDHGLNVAVKKLRRSLGDSAESPRFIETLARRGYRFIAPVENVAIVDAGQAATRPGRVGEEAPAPSRDRSGPKSGVIPALPPHPARRGLLAGAVIAVLAAVAGIALRSRWIGGTSPIVARFEIHPPATVEFEMGRGGLSVSPDGTYLVYCATPSKTGTRQLYLRPMNRNEGASVPGTEGAQGPFFSPDGQWIAFTAGGQLKKVPTAGGTPITLCDAPYSGTGTWGQDGTIFFTVGSGLGGEGKGRLMRVPATGGTPQTVIPAEKTLTELGPRWPQVLPTGDAILYVAGGTSANFSDDATILAQSLKADERKVLVQGGTSPRYLSTGHIVYAQAGRLLAAPFDLRRLEVTGAAFPVVEDVWQGPGGYAAYDVSRNGSLVSLSRGEGNVANRTLSWVDHTGALQPITAPARQYDQPSLSPDAKRLAVAIGDPLRQTDVWILDLDRNTVNRVTASKPGETALAPVWTPDGRRLVYASGAHATSLYSLAADASGPGELLLSSDVMSLPTACSPDGQHLILQRGDWRHFDLWLLNLTGDRKARPLLEGSFSKAHAQISPDGRWLAYSSDESGLPEVYLQPFPGPGDKRLVSSGGGQEPRWSRDGRQLFYRQGTKMLVADTQVRPTFMARRPHLIFEGPYAQSMVRSYDLAPDGQHFLMMKEEGEAQAKQVLHVVLNWTEEVKRRVPAGRN